MTSLFSSPTLPARLAVAVAPMLTHALLTQASERLRITDPNLLAEQLFQADAATLQRIGFSEQRLQGWQQWRSRFDANKILEVCQAQEIRLLFPEEIDFPPLLRQIHSPPRILFVRGTLSTAPAIAMVGSRRHTSYGKEIALQLASEVASQQCVVVSGLALGIDGFVHLGALQAQGLTHAVLAGGVDDAGLYPREHVRLAQRILSERGCLLSEQPPGSESPRYAFPVRNRLIAGLSLATVVIEAAEKSGSLITARLALEENREVLAVPGPITYPTSTGSHLLIRSGAKICTQAKDIFEAIVLDHPESVAAAREQLPLNLEERAVLEALAAPISLEQLAINIHRPATELMGLLSLLELKGLVHSPEPDLWMRQKDLRLSSSPPSVL